jgi:hypothetical protein
MEEAFSNCDLAPFALDLNLTMVTYKGRLDLVFSPYLNNQAGLSKGEKRKPPGWHAHALAAATP